MLKFFKQYKISGVLRFIWHWHSWKGSFCWHMYAVFSGESGVRGCEWSIVASTDQSKPRSSHQLHRYTNYLAGTTVQQTLRPIYPL